MYDYYEQSKFPKTYHLKLMNLNFTASMKDFEVSNLFKELEELGKKIPDKNLIEMLSSSWRSSKVAVWIILVSKREKLMNELTKCLLVSNSYSEHFLVSIAILRPINSGQIISEFLFRQINKFLMDEDILNLDTRSIDWCLALLKHIENTKNELFLNSIFDSKEWQLFTIKVQKLDRFGEMMDTFSYKKFLPLVEKANILILNHWAF